MQTGIAQMVQAGRQQVRWQASRLFLQMLFVMTVACCSVVLSSAAKCDENATRDRRHRQILDRRAVILQGLSDDLDNVSEWCRERQLSSALDEVAALRSTLTETTSRPEPPRLMTPELPASLPAEEFAWRSQLLKARQTRAGELYTLARAALRAGFPSLAFSMIGDVIHFDPDHKFARSVLGQEQYRDPAAKDDPNYAGEWVSAFEKQMRSGQKPQMYDPRFGWIAVASLARYEQGLRPWKGDWISREKEGELRRDFRNAWEIQSEHFLVKTNVSLEAGLEISSKLEIFHAWLQQNFAAFFDTPASLQERFENAGRKSSARKRKPMEVHYYATRDEYQKRIAGKVPPNIETNGLYWQPDRTCYFYQNPAREDFATLFHEATHQIFDVDTTEARRVAARAMALKTRQKRPDEWILCERSNFWLIEGLACYFESFEVHEDGRVTLGDPTYVRFDTARQRLLDPAFLFYLPAQQFFALGKDEFQNHPQISPLYTQASGFAHFLMHYDDGLYRDDLIQLLAEVYRPDADRILEEPSFSRIAGVSWTDLDHQYRIHMQNLDDLIQ
jgi:hypothetical protein